VESIAAKVVDATRAWIGAAMTDGRLEIDISKYYLCVILKYRVAPLRAT
jgi:hypothetical protein